MEVSWNGGTPKTLDGFCSGKSQSEIWMMTGGTPMTQETSTGENDVHTQNFTENS